MKDFNSIQHDLNRDVHNLLTLLKIIKEEVSISDPEINKMLLMAINREDEILRLLDQNRKLQKVIT